MCCIKVGPFSARFLGHLGQQPISAGFAHAGGYHFAVVASNLASALLMMYHTSRQLWCPESNIASGCARVMMALLCMGNTVQ